MRKNGFREAIVAVSGGVDSSLVAAIAVDAVGARAVRGFAMPSRYSSEGSIEDALELAARLDIEVTTLPIDSEHEVFTSSLADVLVGEPVGLTDENLQSRIRAVLMMAISNATGAIVLTTGNKSEMAVGYSTLYGDSAGGFAVIKDVPKTLVYELCHYRNALARRVGDPEPIPATVLEKPPSAELRPDQRDDQSLPPYEVLDPLLELYVEERRHRRGDHRPWLRPRAWSPALLVSSIAASTSAARCPRGCASRRRPSDAIDACPSPTPFTPRTEWPTSARSWSTSFRALTRCTPSWAPARSI